MVGHRGYPGRVVTENTLASFNRAVRAGARGVELDVRVTKDGRFVVMHDDSLRRTTTCRAATVRGRTLGWIVRRCRGVVRGERIPSLGATAGWFRRHPGITPVIELKEGGWTNRRLRRVRDVVTQRRVVGRVLFLSGNIGFLRRVERVAPQLRTQALADSWAEAEELGRTFGALSGDQPVRRRRHRRARRLPAPARPRRARPHDVRPWGLDPAGAGRCHTGS